MSEIAVKRGSGVSRALVPLYLLLLPVPILCFIAALASDAAYAASAFLMWLNDSEWLIAIGLAFGALAALALLIGFLARPALRHDRFGWLHLGLLLAVLVVELFNAFIHTRDGWTAVVPVGISLSAVGAVLALVAVGLLFRMPALRVAPGELRP